MEKTFFSGMLTIRSMSKKRRLQEVVGKEQFRDASPLKKQKTRDESQCCDTTISSNKKTVTVESIKNLLAINTNKFTDRYDVFMHFQDISVTFEAQRDDFNTTHVPSECFVCESARIDSRSDSGDSSNRETETKAPVVESSTKTADKSVKNITTD